MTASNLAEEVILDLLRSAWIVESARAERYRQWASSERRFEAAAAGTIERAAALERALAERGRAPDQMLVGPHVSWMLTLTGHRPDEIPLAELFLARLGDWVELHAGPFVVPEDLEGFAAAGERLRAAIRWPSELPKAPPFEPVETPAVEAPGEVSMRFGILADLHVGSARGDAMAAAAVEELNRSGAAVVIQLGDITEHGNKDEFERAREILARLDMPVVTMMGNHDVFSIGEERLAGREYYPAAFGRDPDGVMLEVDGYRFAVLDSIEHGASPFAPFDLVTGSFAEGAGGAIVRGSLTLPQHEILADVAVPGSPPAFVFLHHPPQPFVGFPPVLFGLRDADSARLQAAAASGNVWGIFAGHTHRNARTRTYGPVPVHEVAMPRDYPFGYALVDVGPAGYAFRFVQLSDKDLLRKAYEKASALHRRYGRGSDEELAFVWRPA